MKVAIALSGGVDSAVAAYLLKQQGHDCIGVTMELPGGSVAGAEAIAGELNIPLHVFDAKEPFSQAVVKPFAESYLSGSTPNPCIECNRDVKFGACLQFACQLGAEYFATGHYARITRENGGIQIKKAFDKNKDQSYYLYGINAARLGQILFPLGGLAKQEVREIARQQGFANADKPESQDICFIPDGDYVSFIENYTQCAPSPGDFIDAANNKLGQHQGQLRYTIGQRKGLGIAWHSPLYVCAKDSATHTVTLCGNDALFSDTLTAAHCNWFVSIPAGSFRAKARIRYRQQEQWATVTPTAENSMEVLFDEPQRAIAKGQHVVLYDEDRVMGGGVIV